MALMAITINNVSTALEHKSGEVAFVQYAVAEAMKEFARGNGTVTSGTITGTLPGGLAATGDGSLGSWTYTPQASLP